MRRGSQGVVMMVGAALGPELGDPSAELQVVSPLQTGLELGGAGLELLEHCWTPPWFWRLPSCWTRLAGTSSCTRRLPAVLGSLPGMVGGSVMDGGGGTGGYHGGGGDGVGGGGGGGDIIRKYSGHIV